MDGLERPREVAELILFVKFQPSKTESAIFKGLNISKIPIFGQIHFILEWIGFCIGAELLDRYRLWGIFPLYSIQKKKLSCLKLSGVFKAHERNNTTISYS